MTLDGATEVASGRLRPSRTRKLFVRHPKARERRDQLFAAGICINGHLPESTNGQIRIEHGPPVTAGGKCKRCADIHKKSRGTRKTRRR
jgi:hypothetical protein